MRGVVAVALALLVSTVASGCFVEDKDPETQGTSATGTTTSRSGTLSSARTTSTGAGSAANGSAALNHAPVANLTAAPVNGTAPLNVTFAIGATDADGDALNWTLAMGEQTFASGNASTLPSNVTHQFPEAGNFTIVLTVSDGQANASANVTIRVEAGAGSALPAGPHYCNVTPDQTVGPIYYTKALGGNWVFRESNQVPGLQVGNSWIGGSAGDEIGESAPEWVDCERPDTLIF